MRSWMRAHRRCLRWRERLIGALRHARAGRRPGRAVDIRHVVVLMLENRSFDCMLGMLYPAGNRFAGLTGTETNIWHKGDGTEHEIQVWTDATLNSQSLCTPDPDPGELFTDIQMQIHGIARNGNPNMSGFVDNYMRQTSRDPSPDPSSVMHYFTPDHVPVLAGLARAFGVSDCWHASAPCQTWANRFFVHTGTAGGFVNNTPTHFPYLMETVFNRLSGVHQEWRIYFHDIPQAATLARLWGALVTRFRHYEQDFARDAASGNLPAYSFIEPRYFPDRALGKAPTDQHPPHNILYGEALIASVYNAVRSGPGWNNTLLVITYDEHGGCYDHVVPPPATPPGGPNRDGFDFSSFGVRVPAVIVSPYVRAGSVIRPAGPTPFDHTSIIATLRMLYGFEPLTPRDAAAPDLLGALQPEADNNGPPAVAEPSIADEPDVIAAAAARPPNNLQTSLSSAALSLPTAAADIAAHIRQMSTAPDAVAKHDTAGSAATGIAAHVRAFLGRS